MIESCSSAMLEEKTNEEENKASEENMGPVKSRLKKINSNPTKRKLDNFDHIKISGDEHEYMCGVVEGFYGRPWTAEQRKELFCRMEEMGLNTYLYAPKDDYKHRLFWREKYSSDEAELLKTLIDEAEQHNVVFVYAISPGLDMVFGCKKEITCLKNKLLQVQSLGCKAFALLFDDIDPVLCVSDMDEFESSAHAQASVTNLMFDVLNQPRFLFCPTEYCTSMAIPDVKNSNYLKTLGNSLHPLISIMWTGPKVVSNVISVESIKVLTSVLKRKVVIWDNIHANDYDPKRVFLGPYKGRSTELVPELAGALTNPNCEFEANYIAMHTLASWWKSYAKKDSLSKPDDAPAEGTSTSEKDADTSLAPTLPVQGPAASSQLEIDESSISSGRASDDSDSDTDSDYSSHDGSLYPSSSNFNHGAYNPNVALLLAIQDWLPIFSNVRYPVRKIVPRSGTPPSMAPNIPIVSHPSIPSMCVTRTVIEPMVSARLNAGSRPPSPAVKDVSAPTTSSVEIDIDKGDSLGYDDKPADVIMAPVKYPSPALDSHSAEVTNEPNVTGEKGMGSTVEKKLEDAKDTNGKTSTSSEVDVEMKDDQSDEKAAEVMQTEAQTPPKPTILVADLMETEEAQNENQTLMQTDEVDSDVSMATAQSGSAAPTDIDEMGSPCPVASEDNKTTNKDNTDTEETKSFVKLVDAEMSTPTTSEKHDASSDKQFQSESLTVESLQLLVECFYLPYEHGPSAKEMIWKFKWLNETAIKLSKVKDKKTDAYLDKALLWSEKALAFEEQCKKLTKVFNQICACPNRALLFDIFPYLWDMKGIVTMLRSYSKWLGCCEVRPAGGSSDERNLSPPSSPSSPPKSVDRFSSWLGPDPEPWAFRGGLSGEFQRLLPVGSSFDLFCQTLPLDPQVCTYIVRPYVPADEVSVFDVCYATHNDGMECSDSFSQHKDLPADELVGALLTLSPEYCFVVEDETGVCGYLAAALNAQKFWKKYEMAYLPEMREKYEKPENDEEMSEVEKMIVDLHSSKDRFSYAPDDLASTHPSLMTLALKQNTNFTIAKNMTVCLLSALKSHNSCGVHVLVSHDSVHLLDLYTKLGFGKINSSDTPELSKFKVLGRTF